MNKIIILIMSMILVLTPKNTVKAASWSVELSNATSGLDDAIALVQNNSTALHDQVMVAQLALEPVVVDQETVKKRYETPKSIQDMAKDLVAQKFGIHQFAAFDAIVRRESNWNPNAVNRSSGACGIPQALPCSKIKDKSPNGQITWMIDYISSRYGTPAQALSFWQKHHWY